MLTGEGSKAKLNAPQVETPQLLTQALMQLEEAVLCAGNSGDQTLLAVFRKAGSSKVADDKRSSHSWLVFVGLCV